MANTKAPRRLVMQNLCQWEYKDKECSYSGADEFTVEGAPITSVVVLGLAIQPTKKSTAGSTLTEGNALVSTNGWFAAEVQGDGNFVIYKNQQKQQTMPFGLLVRTGVKTQTAIRL